MRCPKNIGLSKSIPVTAVKAAQKPEVKILPRGGYGDIHAVFPPLKKEGRGAVDDDRKRHRAARDHAGVLRLDEEGRSIVGQAEKNPAKISTQFKADLKLSHVIPAIRYRIEQVKQ